MPWSKTMLSKLVPSNSLSSYSNSSSGSRVNSGCWSVRSIPTSARTHSISSGSGRNAATGAGQQQADVYLLIGHIWSFLRA